MRPRPNLTLCSLVPRTRTGLPERMSWGGWAAKGGSKPHRQVEPLGLGQAAGGRAVAGRGLPASTTPARDSPHPRLAGRATPCEYASSESRTVEGGRGCRALTRRPGLSSAPPFAAHGNPDASRCEDAHASACTPGQYREGCSHQRGRHSGYGHRGMRLAPHAAKGAPLDRVTARQPGAWRGRPRACPAASRVAQGTPCIL